MEFTLQCTTTTIPKAIIRSFYFPFFYRTSSAMFDLEYDRQLLVYFNGNGALSFDGVMNTPGCGQIL